MPRKAKPVADQLRAAIKAAEKRGVTRYRIAKDGGIPHATLNRFYNGERGLGLDVAEKLARALGGKLTFDI